MLNRIRVVTLLMMVLVVFALLQLISGGLFFSSLKESQQSVAVSNDLRTQQTELGKAWELMLQTRINLSRSSARMMMDANNQQSSAKNDLLKNAKVTLDEAAVHYNAFKQTPVLPSLTEASSLRVSSLFRRGIGNATAAGEYRSEYSGCVLSSRSGDGLAVRMITGRRFNRFQDATETVK